MKAAVACGGSSAMHKGDLLVPPRSDTCTVHDRWQRLGLEPAGWLGLMQIMFELTSTWC